VRIVAACPATAYRKHDARAGGRGAGRGPLPPSRAGCFSPRLRRSGGSNRSTSGHRTAACFSFTLAVTLLTALLFGTIPAMRATRLELTQIVKDRQGACHGNAVKGLLAKSLITPGGLPSLLPS